LKIQPRRAADESSFWLLLDFSGATDRSFAGNSKNVGFIRSKGQRLVEQGGKHSLLFCYDESAAAEGQATAGCIKRYKLWPTATRTVIFAWRKA